MTEFAKWEVRRLARIANGMFVDAEHGAKLTAKTRKALSDSDFAIPTTREYPIHDINHARAALSRAAQFEHGARLAAVIAAVHKRYPQLKSDTKSGS